MTARPRRITLFAGHYGSGKTNVALNYARHLKRTVGGRVAIGDLDIVNPYFRTKDSAAALAAEGIELVVSDYANSNVDFPALPKELYALVEDPDLHVVLDIGGDDRGALALGRYAEDIRASGDYEMLAVVNRSRPLTHTAEDTVEVLREIEGAGHLAFTGIVNNTNLGPETTAEDIVGSAEYAGDVARRMGLPVRFTCAAESLAEAVGKRLPEVFPLALQKLYYQMARTDGKVHFIGIGGVGMAGLAVLMKARGAEVSGCDLKATARTRWLEGQGIPVTIGHDAAHVIAADSVVVTPAVPEDAPERVAAEVRGRVRFRGEALAEIVGSSEAIAVCGSHGKTTTATWIAKLLGALGEDVGWCIGGETGDFPVAHPGKTLVVEADESDGTLARYQAKTLVVTSCEYDHPDHFKTPADYRACFEKARRQAGDVVESETLSPLDELAELPCWKDLAPHNRRNARAAVEVARRRGHGLQAICAVLPAAIAALPDRRFQKLAEGVYADYAHHPTEMACAIAMARRIVTGTLRVLFQPHRYSRTKALLGDFARVLAAGDEVVLCPTYAAFENPIEGGSVADLYAACRKAGLEVKLARSCEEGWTHAHRRQKPGDITLVLGAGDLYYRLRDVAPQTLWIGMGSNTWKSDLDLPVTYVRTRGPADAAGATLGIPWMAGIPGTVGGWIKMNAGAFGHSISEVLEAVKVDGVWRSADECGFAYRTSAIAGEIQDFRLKAGLDFSGEPTAAAYLARRRHFPAGTFGSFFKNPPNDFAGRLLESVGAKELRVGGAYVWSEHANVIVRGPGATASDVLALAKMMSDRVRFRLGVALEPEVRGIASFSEGDPRVTGR